ncbi:MAG: phosphatase [Ignavibacteria bacterium RBG_13_36_8]|nr:MAG: phosphatase [Ignavibacteria bacterium RBG_13_36_8]
MTISKYKHIIWDWNGTLFDDVDLCIDIMNKMLIKYNLKTITRQIYRDVFTVPVIDYYEKLGFDKNDGTFAVAGKEFIDRYEERREEGRLYPHALEVLKLIKEKNINQSILSGYYQETLNEIIPYYNLKEYFDHLIGLGDIYGGSKIDNGKYFIKQLGYEKGETLLIGDTLHDFEVAKAIGADCLLISHGHQSPEHLRTSGVEIINSLSELL